MTQRPKAPFCASLGRVPGAATMMTRMRNRLWLLSFVMLLLLLLRLGRAHNHGDDRSHHAAVAYMQMGLGLLQQPGGSTGHLPKQTYLDALKYLEKAVQAVRTPGSLALQHEEPDAAATALQVYDTAASICLLLAHSHFLFPTKRVYLTKAEAYFGQAVQLAQDRPSSSQEVVPHLLLKWGSAKAELLSDCNATRHAYEPLYRHHANHNVAQLAPHSNELRLVAVSTMARCDPALGVDLWRQMLQHGFLQVQKAVEYKMYWSIVLVSHGRVGGPIAVQEQFDALQLAQHAPYVHAHQVPPLFNPSLVTAQPQPFLKNLEQYAVYRVLTHYANTIQQEFAAYQAHLMQQHAPPQDHTDAALVEAGAWDNVFLRRVETVEPDAHGMGGAGWQEWLCQHHFPQTCRVLQAIPEVNGQLLWNGDNGQKNCGDLPVAQHAWCKGMEGQWPGGVVFYTLAPNSSLKLHTGNTNQRFKCHLVVSAPADNGTAGMEAGGVNVTAVTGNVFCFDDSYLHRVWNESPDTPRVILDVTFFHPALTLTTTTTTTTATQTDNQDEHDEL